LGLFQGMYNNNQKTNETRQLIHASDNNDNFLNYSKPIPFCTRQNTIRIIKWVCKSTEPSNQTVSSLSHNEDRVKEC
jgi:hypothetical protein